MKSILFWDVTPCSLLSCNRRFGGTYRLHPQGQKISRARNQRENGWKASAFTLASCWAYIFSALRMEAIYSSEKSVDFQRTTRRHTQNLKNAQQALQPGRVLHPLTLPSYSGEVFPSLRGRKCFQLNRTVTLEAYLSGAAAHWCYLLWSLTDLPWPEHTDAS
jgi:hypothetical protein